MKALRLVVMLAVYTAAVGLSAQIFSDDHALAADPSATPIANSHLKTIDTVRTYLWNENRGYLTYTKGVTILYRENAGDTWRTTMDSSNIAHLANRGTDHYEQTGCVDIRQSIYKFKVRFRSNFSGYDGKLCGNANYKNNSDLVDSGGRVKITPPAGVPTVIFIRDIDSANKDWQRIYFSKSAITFVYVPKSGAKFYYSNTTDDGRLATKGVGVCDNADDPTCNALVLLSSDSFFAKVTMRSPQGLMDINNDVTQPYLTLTLDPNGGSVVDNSGDGVMIRSYSSTGVVLRDYATGEVASAFPTPTRVGYTFEGWYTSSYGGSHVDQWPMSITDKTLFAHWAPVSGGYVLVPHVDTPSDAVKQGDTVTFTPGVTKDNNTNSNTTNWKFCRLIVAPNATVPAAGSVCSDAKATVVESNNAYVFNGAGPFTIGDPANHVYTVPVDTPYGSQICYALLVDSSTQDPGNPAEAVRCVTVAKYPTVHILGGDVKVGDSTFAALVNQNASIQTGSFNVSGRAYGSWAEYGLFAPASGKIISSSGGMLSGANGADAATVNPVSQNGLTFANVTTYGYWAPAGLLTMPTAIASAASANSSVATTQVDVGANVSAASGEVRAWNITASGGAVNVRGTLPAGSGSVILLYNGTVNINGDIRLGDSTVRSLGNNSQIIIVARNITIDPSVSNVDAWLIATPSTSVSNDGRISTCGAIQTDAYYTGLTLGGECDTTPLRITGTVVARELQLRRSFAGSGAGSNAMAAETINLRPDAYMWGNTNGGSVNIETSFVKELPPRL